MSGQRKMTGNSERISRITVRRTTPSSSPVGAVRISMSIPPGNGRGVSRTNSRIQTGNITQGIFMEDVLSDAYNLKTKIPLKILVNRFMISAYSFKRVTIAIIKTTSRRMQIMEKHNRFTPFFVFAFPSKVSCFMYIPTFLLNQISA